jgi:hypothetical protein
MPDSTYNYTVGSAQGIPVFNFITIGEQHVFNLP